MVAPGARPRTHALGPRVPETGLRAMVLRAPGRCVRVSRRTRTRRATCGGSGGRWPRACS
jgi:hypothetical protein